MSDMAVFGQITRGRPSSDQMNSIGQKIRTNIHQSSYVFAAWQHCAFCNCANAANESERVQESARRGPI